MSFVRTAPARSDLGAVLAVCTYLGGFGLPLNANVPLALLALFSLFQCRQPFASTGTPLLWPVAVFLFTTALSTVGSIDLDRSLRLSAPLVPGTLIFLLIARQTNTRPMRLVLATCSTVALGVSSAVIATAVQGNWRSLHSRVADVGTPILVEANDIALVAVLAPVSYALLAAKNNGRLRWLAAASILAAVIAICILRSRTAFLTLLVAIGTFAWITAQSRRSSWKGVAVLLAGALIIDASLGFPLVTKFQKVREQRIPLAFTTASMFIDAPILGHGPHSFAVLSSRYPRVNLPEWLPQLRQKHVWAHNLYLEFLAERGVVGFAALMFLLALAFRGISGVHRDPDPDVRVPAAGVSASLTAFCFAGIFESSFLRLWVVIVLFTLLGIASHLSSRKESMVSPC